MTPKEAIATIREIISDDVNAFYQESCDWRASVALLRAATPAICQEKIVELDRRLRQYCAPLKPSRFLGGRRQLAVWIEDCLSFLEDHMAPGD